MKTQLNPLRSGRWALVGALAGSLVLGGALAWWPWERTAPRPPAPAPGAQALTAVTSGVPVGLPELAALIGAREARVRARPGDAVSWAVLGAAYVEQGRRTGDAANFPRAEEALRTSLRVRGGRNVEALDGMAALANARHDFPAARSWGEAALKLEPKRWTTYPLLLDAYTGLGDYKATKRTLDRLLELRTGSAVRARAAAVYRDRGWREDAAAALSDAAASAGSPAERAEWLERAGELSFDRGDLDDALRRFEEAVRLDPDQRAAQAGQGRALAAMGRTTEALSAYQVALEKAPCPRYALELGELYDSLGLGPAARAEYDRVRALVQADRSGGVDDELVLGALEADHGDPATAVRRLRAEYARQPGIAVADALGWALHRAGDDKEALRYATVATDRAKGGGVRSALYAYHRGMVERSLGYDAYARRWLQEALRINPAFSPLLVPAAEEALAGLGEPPAEPPPTEPESQES
jgi:tetratricopeptide (TPR) repeat protein